jgi:hypothetical protein
MFNENKYAIKTQIELSASDNEKMIREAMLKRSIDLKFPINSKYLLFSSYL